MSMALVLAFVALTEFLPAEPFLQDFMISKGFSNEEIYDSVLDLYIYFRFPAILGVGFLAEYLGSAPVLFSGALFGFATVAMTTWAKSLWVLQVTQFTVSISTATHMGALFALVLEITEETSRSWQTHVFWTKAALLLANFAAGLVGSLLRYELAVEYVVISEVTLITQGLSVAVAGMLLWRRGCKPRCRPCSKLWAMTWNSFRQRGVSRWTLWSILTHTVHVMVATYWTALARAKTGRQNNSNGYANSACYLLGGLALFGLSDAKVLSVRSHRWWMVSSTFISSGLLVILMGASPLLGEVYVWYILYQLVFRIGSAISTEQVGAEVQESCMAPSRGATYITPDAMLRTPLEGTRDNFDGQSSSQSDVNDTRPPLALLLNITEVLGSGVQVLVQYGFKHPELFGHRTIRMADRFMILGSAIGTAGILYMFIFDGPWSLATLVKARRSVERG